MNEVEKGFYYHYKHDPDGSVNNYAYEVMGTARHTEIQDPILDKFVIYRSLYDGTYYENGKYMGARPRDMFMETVEKDGKTIPRFQKITDSATIQELEKTRDKMYGNL